MHYATQTLDVPLKAGSNSIRFSNNNTYDGGSNPYGGNNASGTAGFTHYTSVPHQYTPAFDRFDLYPQVMTDAVTPSPSAFLSGPDNVQRGQSFDLTFGLKDLTQTVVAQEMILEYDDDLLELAGSPTSLHPGKFYITGYKEVEPGKLRVIAVHLEDFQSNPNQSLAKLPFKALNTEGTSQIRVSLMIVADSDGIETTIDGATHTVHIRKPVIPGDFNEDERVSIGDLALLASAYGKSKDSPDWDQVSHFDLNGDDVIDIEDLVIMAQMILAN